MTTTCRRISINMLVNISTEPDMAPTTVPVISPPLINFWSLPSLLPVGIGVELVALDRTTDEFVGVRFWLALYLYDELKHVSVQPAVLVPLFLASHRVTGPIANLPQLSRHPMYRTLELDKQSPSTHSRSFGLMLPRLYGHCNLYPW
jgi:hypothetical protein